MKISTVKPFRILSTYFKWVSYIIIFIIVCISFSSNFNIFFFHLKPSVGNYWDIAHPDNLFTSKYIRYDDSLFYLYLLIYLLFAAAYRCIAWHSSSNAFFSLITYQYQLIILILPLFFWNMLAMLILVLIKNELNQAHIVQYICLESFQIHLQVIIYHFERTSPNVHLHFLFQNFFILFFSSL